VFKGPAIRRQPKQSAHQKGMRIHHAAATASGDILIQAPFKELRFSFS
jgi:hypothetical protein